MSQNNLENTAFKSTDAQTTTRLRRSRPGVFIESEFGPAQETSRELFDNTSSSDAAVEFKAKEKAERGDFYAPHVHTVNFTSMSMWMDHSTAQLNKMHEFLQSHLRLIESNEEYLIAHGDDVFGKKPGKPNVKEFVDAFKRHMQVCDFIQAAIVDPYEYNLQRKLELEQRRKREQQQQDD